HPCSASRLGGSSERTGSLERLLRAPELDEQAGAVGLHRVHLAGQATLFGEGDPLLEVGERAGGPLERVPGDHEVVLENAGLVAFSLLDMHGERSLHLGEAVRVAEVGTGAATSAERPGRLRKAKSFGERAGTVCSDDRLAMGAR